MNRKNETNRKILLDDEKIIELFWDRDEKAIEATADKYEHYLFTIAYNIIHDRLDCEECLNDTYLGAWNRIPPNRPGVFPVFLSKITRNLAVGRLRMSNAQKRVPTELMVSLDELEDCISESRTPDEEYFIAEVSRILNEYLRTLNERREFVFVCRYYYADYITDIAKMLGLNEKTVKRELLSIRDGLKKALEKEGYFNE